MTIPDIHPDDERLSALAGADPDAAGDAPLRRHVSGCDRCAAVVDDLSRLRAALATLPDVAPPRPLRLLPAALERQPSLAERAASVVRRVFAPVLAAGATVALVGAVGTAGDFGLIRMPSMGGAAAPGSGGEAGQAPEREVAQEEGAGGGADAAASAAAAAEPYADGLTEASPIAPTDAGSRAMSAVETPLPAGGQPSEEGDFTLLGDREPVRSPWPMVLFAGVSVVIVTLLLRWILPPRAS